MFRSALLAAALLSAPAAAQDGFIEWRSENVQLLRGTAYELGPRERTVVTVEHAHRNRWGDFFLFADFAFAEDGEIIAYGEITPRLSLSRLTGQDWSAGPVRDVLLAANYERGEGGLERYLGGVAMDFDAPGFRFLRAHAFLRDDPRRSGTTWQATFVWNAPFEIGGQAFLAEGFADIAGAEGAGVANQLAAPRLLWDAGVNFDAPGRIFLGVEHQYWRNKFGVDGVTESVTQLQLKFVLP